MKVYFEWLTHYLAVMLLVCLSGGAISFLLDLLLADYYHHSLSRDTTFLAAMVLYGTFFFVYAHVFFLFLIPALFTYLRTKKGIASIKLSLLGLVLGVLVGYVAGDFYSLYIHEEKQYKNIVVFSMMLLLYPVFCQWIQKITRVGKG